MRYVKTTVLAILIMLIAGLSSSPARAGVSFSYFQSNLSSHGSWSVSAQYGQVWQPSVYTESWNPYYDGHWAYTDLGCTWVSDYSWGAIPYHYGTWVLDPALGWVWVPGYVWAPSWVVFRTGPDYIGWAPVSPQFSVGVSFGSGAPVSGGYVFVSSHDFLAPRIRSYVVPESRTNVIINRTTVVNNIRVEKNIVVNRGPDVSIVERASGRKVRAVPIEQVSRVAPEGRIERSQLSVDPQMARRGLRAAEPERGNKSPTKAKARGHGNSSMRPETSRTETGSVQRSAQAPAVASSRPRPSEAQARDRMTRSPLRETPPAVERSVQRSTPAPRLASPRPRPAESRSVYRQPIDPRSSPRGVAPSKAPTQRPVAAPSARTKSKPARKPRPARPQPGSNQRPTGEQP